MYYMYTARQNFGSTHVFVFNFKVLPGLFHEGEINPYLQNLMYVHVYENVKS